MVVEELEEEVGFFLFEADYVTGDWLLSVMIVLGVTSKIVLLTLSINI